MARHNRRGRGTDQRGFKYEVSYQPDWLRHVKISRALPTGRQSTMMLFRNPHAARDGRPSRRVRTRITCREQDVDVEVAVGGGKGAVRQLTVSCEVPSADGDGQETVTFILEKRPPRPS